MQGPDDGAGRHDQVAPAAGAHGRSPVSQRSFQIMRGLLRDIASGKQTTGDTSTLEDYSVLSKLRQEDE